MTKKNNTKNNNLINNLKEKSNVNKNQRLNCKSNKVILNSQQSMFVCHNMFLVRLVQVSPVK